MLTVILPSYCGRASPEFHGIYPNTTKRKYWYHTTAMPQAFSMVACAYPSLTGQFASRFISIHMMLGVVR